jgi:lysylphosphatidylglycerol synthetase-like protein (DUF2156 family)
VAIATRKTATVYIGLCPVHRAKRRQAIWFAWLSLILGCVVIAVLASVNVGARSLYAEMLPVFIILAVVMTIAGIVFWSIRARVVSAKKIDQYFVWIKGVSPEFLSELPPR